LQEDKAKNKHEYHTSGYKLQNISEKSKYEENSACHAKIDKMQNEAEDNKAKMRMRKTKSAKEKIR